MVNPKPYPRHIHTRPIVVVPYLHGIHRTILDPYWGGYVPRYRPRNIRIVYIMSNKWCLAKMVFGYLNNDTPNDDRMVSDNVAVGPRMRIGEVSPQTRTLVVLLILVVISYYYYYYYYYCDDDDDDGGVVVAVVQPGPHRVMVQYGWYVRYIFQYRTNRVPLWLIVNHINHPWTTTMTTMMTIQWMMMIMRIVYGGHPKNSISDANSIRYTSALVPNIRVRHVLLLRVGVV
jgi:hypothetical protein